MNRLSDNSFVCRPLQMAMVLLAGSFLLAALPSSVQADREQNQLRSAEVQARPYETIESEILAEMRTLLALRRDLEVRHAEAREREREVMLAKNSMNVINRILLPGRIEDLHALLARIEEREAEAARRQAKIDALADEAETSLKRADRWGAMRGRLETVTGRRVARLEREIADAREKIIRNQGDRPDLERSIERNRAELEEARRDFNAVYGS